MTKIRPIDPELDNFINALKSLEIMMQITKTQMYIPSYAEEDNPDLWLAVTVGFDQMSNVSDGIHALILWLEDIRDNLPDPDSDIE